MSKWLVLKVSLVWLPGGLLLIVVLELVKRHLHRWDGRYVKQIQVLKAETPLQLPAVRPLKGRFVRWNAQRLKRRA